MTAYVCYALVQAQKAGFRVNNQVLDSGLRELADMLRSKKIRTYPRAFAAYVLALAGQDSTPVMERLAGYRTLPNEAIATLALGFEAAGQHDRARAVLDRLFAHAVSDGNMTYWKGGARYDGGDVEPTALALQAVLKINPGDPRAYQIVRWLMSQWRDEYWTSTRATAMALYGMSEFLAATNELSPDFTATVMVNGKKVGNARFNSASIYKPQVQITVQGRDLKKGRNELKIVKVGTGNLYYSTNLTQSLDQKSMPAVLSSAGLTVTREYFRPSSTYFQTDSPRDLGSPVDSCRVGDTVLVRLTIRSESLRSHVMLEDNIPAGCEIITQGNVEQYSWENWWVGQDVRDDKIAFYLNEVTVGKHVVEYQMRAGFAGTYCALPTELFSMYDPNVRATSEASEFDVR
jgi:alpha-2-macroglobulin